MRDLADIASGSQVRSVARCSTGVVLLAAFHRGMSFLGWQPRAAATLRHYRPAAGTCVTAVTQTLQLAHTS